MRRTLMIISLFLAMTITMNAQGFIETECLQTSKMYDKQHENHGKGDLLRVKGRYTIPFSMSVNEKNQPTAWSATLSASYASMNNKGEANMLNPNEIVNASFNVTHIRPLSAHWQLIASLGVGIYAEPNEIAWRSILANGAVIFAYKYSDNLSFGVGMGLTNSYGVPIVMPMGYLNWRTSGNIKVQVDMASGMTVKASTMFNKHFGLELTAFEIDGMSAVRRIDGKTKIYSTMMMRSSLSPTFCISNKIKLRLGIGGTWLRSAKITNRSLKDFFKSFSNNDGQYKFDPAMRVNLVMSHKLQNFRK